ncbi:uncharacterized protein LOC129572728, partial [Sitodiplosis mosellana]|uniref:uncharacterized protein LOC129572728 n=1 Tax=Sitodiplosis mosellana TaxID=263140 RepID=UPI00244508DC
HFDDAIAIKDRLRNVQPPIYNERRMNETPIPPVHIDDEEEQGLGGETETEAEDESCVIDHYNQSGDEFTDIAIDPLASFASTIDDDGNELLQVSQTNDNEVVEDDNTTGQNIEQTVERNMNDSTIDEQNESEMAGGANNGDQVVEPNTDEAATGKSNETTNENSNDHVVVVVVEQNMNVIPNVVNENNTSNPVSLNDDSIGLPFVVAEGSVVNPEVEESEQNPNVANNVDVKPVFQEILIERTENDSDLDDILSEEKEVVLDEHVTMLVGPHGIPKPLATTTDDLLKRENDGMSGNIPFNERKKGRVYKIGTKKAEIPYKVIDKILEWNEDRDKRNNIDYDRKMCQMLVMSLTPKDDIRTSKISSQVIEFVKACFIVRCGENEERIGAVEMYINDLCTEKAKQTNEATA